MQKVRALYRLSFIHSAFYGYVACARDSGDSTSVMALAQIFCDNHNVKIECETIARQYYDTLQLDREFKKSE